MHLQRSARDIAAFADTLSDHLAADSGVRPALTVDAGTDANGMSSETVMVDATWPSGHHPESERWVMRMQPRPEDIPVFDHYRLDHQYEVMSLLARTTGVPIPRVHHLKTTGAVLGSPFFLMERIDGLIPPDVMPYTFGTNWLFEATPEQQRRVQDSTIDRIAELHSITDAPTVFGFLDDEMPAGGDTLHRRLAWLADWYESSAASVGRSPLAEGALAWLTANLPADAAARPPVLCWGDARIGNVIYEDFTPVALLDWEMACLGPRELDVSWLIFAHNVFQELADMAGLPGMPDLLREDDVRERYLERTGVELADLRWFSVFAGVVWCCVFLRAGARRVHFGEQPPPSDIDVEFFYHRNLLARLIEGEA
ncbi:phosphotransferase family protein [Gordonia desulfuricans]|uniref:Phosphotransferase family protein n=1 Tax=Gordonia desulfuricans TaxID=89051 RepID=A0A7K3LJU2_9ACTN|nr:phosphotransferase family protein [Gordonia desulfuricans]NDK88525.1 phosphotransferase family protein [Gordonia desulfuricans]